jgi:phosphoribosylformylglycinamidine synthase
MGQAHHISAGVGQLDGRHTAKGGPEPRVQAAKVGGPAHRIGDGSGAASLRVRNSESADLDFKAVQRGDRKLP